MMRLLVIFGACFVGLYLGGLLTNAMGVTASGGFDMGDALEAAVVALTVIMAVHIF